MKIKRFFLYTWVLFVVSLLYFGRFNAIELYASEIEEPQNSSDVNNENKEWSLYAGNIFDDVLKAVGEGVKQGINEGLKSTRGQKGNAVTETNRGQETQQEEPQRQRKSITDISDYKASDTNLSVSSSSETTDLETSILPKSKQPIIVTVDGICMEAEYDFILNDMCWTSYLRDALSSELADYLTAPFQWTGDTRDTQKSLEYAKKFIEGFYQVAQKRGVTFEIIAHSWGSVLSYIVLKQNPNIKVDTFITLGSPLRANLLEIKKYTEKYTGKEIGRLNNVGKWVNYWAWNDVISGEIKAANKNILIDKVAINTDDETRMMATKDFHSKYYTEWKSSIISELAQQLKIPQLSEPVLQPDPVSDLIEVTVTGIDDGDTIKVVYKGKDWQVRLIGVDTPETVRGDKLNNDAAEWNIPVNKVLEMGNEAKRYVESLIRKGDKVKLEFDENSEVKNGEKVDPYNRLLCYVYLKNDTFLNFRLLRKGYARFTPRNWRDGIEFPEKKYQELFQNLEDLAKSNKEGFWKIWLTGYGEPLNSEIVIAIPKEDVDRTGKEMIFPIAYFSDNKYHEISVGGALNENEVARENKYLLPMLNKVKQYTMLSNGEVIGNFTVDRVKFGGGMGCDFAYIPEGKFVKNGIKDIDKKNALLLSAINQGSANKLLPLKNTSNDIFTDLTEIARKQLLNAKEIKPSNINMSTLKIDYLKSYDTNNNGTADLFIVRAVVDLFKSIDGGEISGTGVFMIVSLTSTRYRTLYSSEPLNNDAGLIGTADIDGDGNMEIVITTGYYEAWKFEIWRYVNGGLIKVYSGTDYGC